MTTKSDRFRELYGEGRRLEYGLDFVKVMPADWSDAQRLAKLVELYDELRDETPAIRVDDPRLANWLDDHARGKTPEEQEWLGIAADHLRGST